MHMTQNDKIAFAALSGAGITLLATTAAWFWDKRQHVKVKKEIKSNTDADFSRMMKAAEVVTQNIRDGKYDKTGLPGIKNDFDFYRMIIDTEI